MKLGLIGLPKSGKTTIFNALTRSQAEVAAYASGKVEPNIAAVEVEDSRVTRLSEMYQPKKTIYAVVDFMDFVGTAPAGGKEDLFSGEAMGLVKTSEALVGVLRNFPHEVFDSAQGAPDPLGDAESIAAELILSDLVLVETRLERIAKDHDRGKKTPASQGEETLLKILHQALNDGIPLRDLDLNPDQRKLITGFQFLSAKPLMMVLNSGEENYGRNGEVLGALNQKNQTMEFAGNFEMELAQLEDQEEARAFMEDLGITASARNRFTTLAYESLGLLSFFTVGTDEVRAWTIHKGETSVDAAGAIHSDLARGFIRAECFSCQDLLQAGSEKGVKEAGAFRLEGKEYQVQDGDILNIRFSV